MAEKDIGALVVTLEAQTAAFEKGMQSATKELQKFGGASKAIESQLTGVQGAFVKFNQATQAISTSMNLVMRAFGAVKEFSAIRERLAVVQSSFEAVLGSASRAADMLVRVKKISNELGSDLPSTASAVRRMAIGLSQLGSSNDEIDRITTTFLKLGAVGGSIEEATGAIFQFSQALGAGTLRGDELVSLLERQPLIAIEIAKYLKEIGLSADGSIGSLRKLGSEGKISSQILKDALLNAEEAVAKKFAAMPMKLSQVLNRINNTFQEFASDINEAIGFNETITGGLKGLGDAISSVLKPAGEFLKWLDKTNTGVLALTVSLGLLAIAFKVTLASAILAAIPAIVAFGSAFVAAVTALAVPLAIIGTIGAAIYGLTQYLDINMIKIQEWWITIAEKVPGVAKMFKGAGETVGMYIGRLNEDLEKAKLKAQGIEIRDPMKEPAEKLTEFEKAQQSSLEAFRKNIQSAKVEASILGTKIKELERLIATEKDPKLLKQWEKQLKDTKASGDEFTMWLESISEVKFGDTLPDLERQLLELERLLNNTKDPVVAKKYEAAIKNITSTIEDATNPMAELERQIVAIGEAAEKIPEKLAYIDKALAEGRLTPENAQKLRDQIQGIDSDFKKLGEDITDSIAGNASNAVNNFIDTIGRAKFSFADFTEAVVKDIAKIIFQLLIMKPIVESIKRSLQSFGGGGGVGPELLNEFFADGGSFERGTGLKQGVYDSPQLFKFADGGVFGSRIGVMGEAGPEAIMPLKRNSQGRLGVEAAPTNITIINNAGADVQATETTNSDGTKQIDIYVERKVKEMFGGGAMDKSMKASYGLTRVGV
jgi:tape measure domain-containing protein